MKINDFKKELASLNNVELQERLDTLRRDLFSLKLNSSTAHIKDYSQFKKLKNNIARVLTHMHAKQAK